MQNIGDYVINLPDDAVYQYPCFLLELSGTAFSVWGILNTAGQIIGDPLSPTYSLLCNQDFAMTEQIAKLFASLRRHLPKLRSQHSNRSLLPVRSFPYLSTFQDRNTNNAQFTIQYQEKIKGLLCSALVLDSEREVIVKFCSRYNLDVHLYCHSCGFAPALISYTTHGRYVVVVMEKMALRDLTQDDLAQSEIKNQIERILSKLKDKKYVHGDLRCCNILFDTGTNKVVLVDFDWSGLHEISVYPPFMNPAIPWPEGALTGKPLLHEHDLNWIGRLYS